MCRRKISKSEKKNCKGFPPHRAKLKFRVITIVSSGRSSGDSGRNSDGGSDGGSEGESTGESSSCAVKWFEAT